MLHISQLRHSLLGDEIVARLDLEVHPGEVVCLYGPSGCGKTTVLRIIAGLSDYDSGRICNSFSHLHYLFQEHRLLPWRTLWENVLLTAANPRSEASRAAAAQLLARLHLGPADWGKYPHELSGGMRQRAALARALVCTPALLLLDEPFSALDYELKLSLYQWLAEYVAQGMAMLMVSHDRFEVLHMAHRVYLLDAKPARCRQMLCFDRPPGKRDDAYIRHHLQQDYWQAYHE